VPVLARDVRRGQCFPFFCLCPSLSVSYHHFASTLHFCHSFLVSFFIFVLHLLLLPCFRSDHCTVNFTLSYTTSVSNNNYRTRACHSSAQPRYQVLLRERKSTKVIRAGEIWLDELATTTECRYIRNKQSANSIECGPPTCLTGDHSL
jgi:hypothetical protein